MLNLIFGLNLNSEVKFFIDGHMHYLFPNNATYILISTEKENHINSNINQSILLITKEISDLCCKEILRSFYNSMVLFVKNPDLYSESVYISQVEGQGYLWKRGLSVGVK